jgi:hypothetical protein
VSRSLNTFPVINRELWWRGYQRAKDLRPLVAEITGGKNAAFVHSMQETGDLVIDVIDWGTTEYGGMRIKVTRSKRHAFLLADDTAKPFEANADALRRALPPLLEQSQYWRDGCPEQTWDEIFAEGDELPGEVNAALRAEFKRTLAINRQPAQSSVR